MSDTVGIVSIASQNFGGEEGGRNVGDRRGMGDGEGWGMHGWVGEGWEMDGRWMGEGERDGTWREKGRRGMGDGWEGEGWAEGGEEMGVRGSSSCRPM